jgi:hypothetical protein
MAWTLLAIAGHPEVEERVVAELDSLGLLAKPGCAQPRELQVGDLSNLPYLTAVIKESMRLFSVHTPLRTQDSLPNLGKPVGLRFRGGFHCASDWSIQLGAG